MSDGDESAGTSASSIGLAIMTGLEPVWRFFRFINSTRDMLADHITTGSHSAEQISSGTLDPDRLPDIPLDKLPGIPGSYLSGSINVADSGGDVRGANLVTPGSIIAPAVYASVVSSGHTLAIRSDGSFGYFPSSRRFKKNLKRADLAQLADIADALADTIHTFRWRATVDSDQAADLDVIAEDVAEVYPLAVTRDAEGEIDGVDWRKVIAPLVAAVHQLRTRVDELEKGARP